MIFFIYFRLPINLLRPHNNFNLWIRFMRLFIYLFLLEFITSNLLECIEKGIFQRHDLINFFLLTFSFQMKYCVLIFFAVAIATVRAATYSSRFDGIDIEQILNSERLLTNYYKCLMEEGKCTPDGRELKQLLPDALKTKCSKCTPKQQEGTDKVIRFLIENKPEQWKNLQKKYDPEDVYIVEYRKEAEARGIKI